MSHELASIESGEHAPAGMPWGGDTSDAQFLSAIVETQNDLAAVELDANTVMRVVAERTQRLTGADGATFQVLDGDYLVCRAVSGQMAPYPGTRFALSSSLAGYAIRTGRYAVCTDTTTDDRVDRAVTTRSGIRSLVIVPLFLGAKVIGVVSVSSARTNAFGPRHVSALRLMAGLAAAALTHASEFEAKRRLLVERTAALAALRESEERFRAAFEHAAIGMALVGLDGRWLQVNRVMCEIVGYTETELLATNFQAITHANDLQADLEHLGRLVAGEARTYQLTKRYVHRRGHLVWVLLSVSIVRDDAGKPLYFISQVQDVTGRKHAEDALRASEDDYRRTFETVGVGKAQVGLRTGRFIRVNTKLCEMLGYSADELQTLSFAQISHVEDVAAGRAVQQSMLAREATDHTLEKRYVRKDGRVMWAITNIAVLPDTDGTPRRAIATIQDITERKHAEWLERDRRKVLELVALDMPLPDVIAELAAAVERQIPDTVAAVWVLSNGAVQLHGTGLPPEWSTALSQNALRLAAGLASGAWDTTEGCGVSFLEHDELWRAALPNFDRSGFATCWSCSINANDGSPLGLLTAFNRQARRPTTEELRTLQMCQRLATICIEHHNTTRQLSHLVRHDALTGLPNRMMYEDRICHALALSRRTGTRVGIMVLDIDHFKSINDTLGHHAGDHVLQQFAQRLSSQLRETDTMARVGGDEFVVILPNVKSPDAAAAVARKLIASLADPFHVGDRALSVTTSIGIAIHPDDAADPVALQQKADAALYRVKQRGRNGFSF